MKYFLLASTIFITLLFSSCNNYEKEKQLMRVDSLLHVSSVFQNRLDSFNTDTIAIYYSTILNFNKVLVEKLHGLPESELMKNKLLKMSSVEKGFKKIPDKLLYFQNEIKFSIDQLNALRNDVKLGLLKNDEFEAYFNDELQSINNISPELDKILKVLSKHIQDYKILLPDVKFYVDSLANSK